MLGWPVAHSLSPRIQNAALAAVGRGDWRYQLLPAPAHLLGEIIHALPAAGFAGVNVTIPHKLQALRQSTRATPRARAIGAANTLTFGPGGEIDADNTDAPALVAALPFEMAGRSALVLGAGGSARAAVWALLDAGASSVRVWNRTPERARELCAQLGGEPETSIGPADVLINCTSVGLDGSSPFDALPVSADGLTGYACVADLVYTGQGTKLIDAARERGVTTVDGLELLVGQGAIAFERFTGMPAPIEAMRAAVGRRAGAVAGANGRPQPSATEPSG
ncbi:MAG: shikimate dehydrogenase family protein [Solirubrobacteraceae bacterium]